MDAQPTSPPDRRLTQGEFFAWLQERPDSDINHYELIHGRIVMTPPAGFIHGAIGANLVFGLSTYVRRHQLGRVLDSSVGYDLPSGDTLEPDVSFVSNERLAAGPPPELGRHARLVPDLVVEVLSPSTARRDRTVKKDIYAANGVREYWLVDPKRRTVVIFQSLGERFDGGVEYGEGVVCSRLFPELELGVEAVFA